MEIINLITLAVIGYIDYERFKIPNVILIGWLITFILIKQMDSTNFYISPNRIIASALVAGSYIPFRRIVKCHAGDFKLYGVLTVICGLNDMFNLLFISSSIALFPLTMGMKKVAFALFTLFGYVAFILLKYGEKV